MNLRRIVLFVFALLLASASTARESNPLPIPAHGVIGVEAAQMSPGFWVDKADAANQVLMSKAAIVQQNVQLLARDSSMHDLGKIPATLKRAQVRTWITSLSRPPHRTLYDSKGRALDKGTIAALQAQLNLDAIPESQPTRYGMVVHRANLRSFPTNTRVFSAPGNTDIDRFQETGVFPGTPVVIAHASSDGDWLFVVSPRYAAWVEKDAIAEGTRATVLGYASGSEARVITGAQVRTVFTPEQPQLSELKLDMGLRVPLATKLEAGAPVNGQSAYTSWPLLLPIRKDDGSLALKPALLQRVADSRDGYLPLTRANIITQAFKFLGERYGWGHMYNGRDCSGFVSEVYRSMGVVLPRNTSSQSISPALQHHAFSADDDHTARLKAVENLAIGDLVFIPGHVMMVIGHLDGKPWVIHDTTGISYRDKDGSLRRVKLNEVSVTPLMPLQYNDHSSTIDHITSIVRVAH